MHSPNGYSLGVWGMGQTEARGQSVIWTCNMSTGARVLGLSSAGFSGTLTADWIEY